MLFSRLPVVDMLVTWWQRIGGKFPDVQMDEAVVMRNHVHGVVWLADGCLEARTGRFDVVHGFKTKTTNAYVRGVHDHAWAPFPGRLWQRNYWEPIAHDARDLNRICNYIRDNLIRWEHDRLHPLQPPCVGEETPF
jgi:REP element-mobilizing transposase RayT